MIGFVLLGLAVVMNQVPNLQQLQWRNRVVLLFAKDAEDAQLAKQKAAFEKVAEDLKERDIEIFELTGESEDVRRMREQFEINGSEFRLVLVGKDGSSKLRRAKPVPPAEIFHLVDSMPMRQNEIRDRK